MAIFMELHQARQGSTADEPRLPHYHVALQAKRSFRYLPFKRALRVHHNLATSWSSGHPGYFSAVRYCYLPSLKKPQSELDPAPRVWAADGHHKPLFDACQEPITAAATKKRRESKVRNALEKGKPEPRATEMDLYAAIVEGGFRNTPDDRHAWRRLVAHLKETAPALFTYAFKIRAKLPGLIDDVWSWETVDDSLTLLSMTRVGLLQHAAAQLCPCSGAWMQQASLVLRNNLLDPAELFTDIVRALAEGRGPTSKVVVLAGQYGGEGKSFLLAPLRDIFGQDAVQETPTAGSFPLMGLEEKRVVLLDEWTFKEDVISFATQLVWFEGKPVILSRPQNQAGSVGHTLYQGTAPIFITTKLKDLMPIQQAAEWARRAGKPSAHTMLLRRLKVHSLSACTAAPAGAFIHECGVCFARMALQHSTYGRQPAAQPAAQATATGSEIDPNDL